MSGLSMALLPTPASIPAGEGLWAQPCALLRSDCPAGSPHHCCCFQLAPAKFHYWPGAVLVTGFEMPKSLMKECPGMMSHWKKILTSDPELDNSQIPERHLWKETHISKFACKNEPFVPWAITNALISTAGSTTLTCCSLMDKAAGVSSSWTPLSVYHWVRKNRDWNPSLQEFLKCSRDWMNCVKSWEKIQCLKQWTKRNK